MWPSLDQTLLDVSEMVETLTAEGIPVERYQMTSHPHRFMNNAEVMRLVREKQMEALPITPRQRPCPQSGRIPPRAEIRTAYEIECRDRVVIVGGCLPHYSSISISRLYLSPKL
ncbi:MAG: arsenic metallochaperone ArsD family protein [Chloroflexi bacterium]|nr:arsenic metallochaperone ArsD family protein [Chloroflexota bacterium]